MFFRLRRQIERGLRVAENSYTFADLGLAIERGRFQLFYCADAILVVEIVSYPQYRAGVFFLAAGRLPSVFALEDDASIWLVENGCKHVTLYGRRGWTRALKDRGWREIADKVVMQREL